MKASLPINKYPQTHSHSFLYIDCLQNVYINIYENNVAYYYPHTRVRVVKRQKKKKKKKKKRKKSKKKRKKLK